MSVAVLVKDHFPVGHTRGSRNQQPGRMTSKKTTNPLIKELPNAFPKRAAKTELKSKKRASLSHKSLGKPNTAEAGSITVPRGAKVDLGGEGGYLSPECKEFAGL